MLAGSDLLPRKPCINVRNRANSELSLTSGSGSNKSDEVTLRLFRSGLGRPYDNAAQSSFPY